MNCYFYLPNSALNDATAYYCDLVRKAFKRMQINIVDITDIKGRKLEPNSYSFTIRIKDYLEIYKHCQFNVFWFQGILPEEILLIEGKTIKNKLRSRYISTKERKVLKTSSLCLFVSKAMRDHYRQKYQCALNLKSLIIPCYNQTLKTESFYYKRKYCNLDFVYAGCLSSWLCIDEAMQDFKHVQAKAPDATFTVFTKNRVKIDLLIEKYSLRNVFTTYVPLESLQAHLAKYKYAFLLRREDKVNTVSTPTKMNSYLASGLIPIYTDVIDSFENHIELKEFSVKVNLENETLEQIADKIFNHHELNIDPDLICQRYITLFDEYYNDEMYIRQLQIKLTE